MPGLDPGIQALSLSAFARSGMGCRVMPGNPTAQKQLMSPVVQDLNLRQALKLLQHRVLQPAISADVSKDRAEHTLLQERKSSLQTRTLWLPALQGEGVG